MALLKFGNHILKQGKFLSVAGSPFKQTVFNDIGEIYANLQPGDKVAFLIRHGQRPTEEWGPEVPLTEEGIRQARLTGSKIQAGIASKNQIEAHSTETVRTQQTAFYIAESRGDDLWPEYTDVPTDHNINSELYYTNSEDEHPYHEIAAFAYGELIDVAPEAMDKYQNLELVTNYIMEIITGTLRDSDKPVHLFTSHDSVILPFTVKMTNNQLQLLRFWENHHWLNYCAGTAVILRANGVVETYPIKGLDSGWFRPW